MDDKQKQFINEYEPFLSKLEEITKAMLKKGLFDENSAFILLTKIKNHRSTINDVKEGKYELDHEGIEKEKAVLEAFAKMILNKEQN